MPVPPWLFLIGGALILPVLPKLLRSPAFLLTSLLSMAFVWFIPEGARFEVPFASYTLILCQMDQLSRVFGTIFALIAFAGGVYGFRVQSTGEQVAALLYAASALGVTFAGDYVTLFFFWELMAVSSTYLVWARRTVESQRAGIRYLLVHLFGGSLLLAGILLHTVKTGTILISAFEPDASASAWLILGGVALNAAIPPLHAWLVDAYPRATVAGAVFLSAFTTKAAVYVLVRIFPGWDILIAFGVLMALYGVVYAVLANDIREILAYHIISQVGYMVAGVGIGTEMSLNGTTAHAFSHILYKALLFMGAGVVLHTTGRSKLTELGGLARAMPAVLALYMVGAFSISGFPLFNGFISKGMVVSAAAEAHFEIAVLLLHLASVGTFLHTGLKLPYFTWFAEESTALPTKTPPSMLVGMSIVAFFCALFGIAPSLLYRHLPFNASFEPYTIPHLVETTQLLVFTFMSFWVFRRHLRGEFTISLDTDWLYRKPARVVNRSVVLSAGAFFDAAERIAETVVKQLTIILGNPWPRTRGIFQHEWGANVPAAFEPNAARPPMEKVIALVLACFLLAALLSVAR
ncbi:MAG: Na(+)/H(+) antiporter subunit D [Ignavibacteria bacterium]|nr:Na(+)/H(+) antiporter subunit D [Ignavibacteria bacterium]